MCIKDNDLEFHEFKERKGGLIFDTRFSFGYGYGYGSFISSDPDLMFPYVDGRRIRRC